MHHQIDNISIVKEIKKQENLRNSGVEKYNRCMRNSVEELNSRFKLAK